MTTTTTAIRLTHLHIILMVECSGLGTETVSYVLFDFFFCVTSSMYIVCIEQALIQTFWVSVHCLCKIAHP